MHINPLAYGPIIDCTGANSDSATMRYINVRLTLTLTLTLTFVYTGNAGITGVIGKSIPRNLCGLVLDRVSNFSSSKVK